MRSLRLIVLMIAAEVLAMLGTSAVPATLPALIAQWQLSPAAAGWLGGAYFLGYAAAVPVLVSLTDRIDPRFIFALGCAIGVIGNVGFGTVTSGLPTATLFWVLAGISMAGIYMPGLRVITERVDLKLRLRAVPYYTASFGIGISASFFVAGWVSQLAGWRAAFVTGGVGCIAAVGCLVLATVQTRTTSERRTGSGAFDVRAVLRNHAALRYILAYGGHCWELFALRSWIVAFLFFVWNRTNGGNPGHALTSWSSIVALAGVPASIVGAEVALRAGRRRLISTVALASVGLALATAWLGTQAFLVAAGGLVLYNIAVLSDSGALTAGVVDAATPEAQGSTLALHSLVGFIGGALGPMAVGITIGLAGGSSAVIAWGAALAVMAAGSALAAVAVLMPKRG